MIGYEPGAIWPVNNPDEVQIREVYSRFGLAMYLAQVLEYGLVNVMAVFSIIPKRKTYCNNCEWEAAHDDFYKEELGNTFGTIMKKLQKMEVIPSELMARLWEAKEKRDYLAHRFFREHDKDFFVKEGRASMILECETIITIFSNLDHEIENMISPIREQYGITTVKIEEALESLKAGIG